MRMPAAGWQSGPVQMEAVARKVSGVSLAHEDVLVLSLGGRLHDAIAIGSVMPVAGVVSAPAPVTCNPAGHPDSACRRARAAGLRPMRWSETAHCYRGRPRHNDVRALSMCPECAGFALWRVASVPMSPASPDRPAS
ncbi:hypothetical protein LUTEI9C_20064 [Luteimonas sp. 9C]|nr:hypothetical protein LUTEI9C_20064 [Luteimonas sp. 9C]